jgi:hypothetical protein
MLGSDSSIRLALSRDFAWSCFITLRGSVTIWPAQRLMGEQGRCAGHSARNIGLYHGDEVEQY